MSKQFNLKDDRAIELARGLAVRKGTSMTAIIRDLLEAEQQRMDDEVERRVAEILETGRRFRADLPPELLTVPSKEWMDSIFDDDGLAGT